MSTATLDKKARAKSPIDQINAAPVAIYESGDCYVVMIELPGADEKAIELKLKNGTLRVEAPKGLEVPPGAVQRYAEFQLGAYQRTVKVGEHIEEEKIDAIFKSGVLKVTLPKSKAAQAVKVPVKVVQ